MYRAAILGCGPRAVGHAEAYAHVASGRLVAACDLDRDRLDRFCDRFGIEGRFAEFSEMLTATQPDLLHIVTTPERAEIVARAVRFPLKAILLEKPLACRPSAGYAMLDACGEAGVPLFINHQLRHHRPFQRVREAILGGEIGELLGLRGSCKGRLMEQGTHLLDLMSYLQDDAPARSILAQAEGAASYAIGHPSPDNVLIALRWRDDLPVILESGPASATWCGEPNFWLNKAVEATGTRGVIASSTNHGWWMVTDRGASGEEFSYEAEDLLAQARLTEGIFRTFTDLSFRHPNRPEVSAVAFSLCQAALRSALERRRISLPGERVPDVVFDRLRAELERGERAALRS